MSEPGTPRVRARWSQRVLEQATSVDPELRGRLAASIPDAIVRIERASPLEWVDLVDHVAMLDTLLATIGHEDFARIYRRSATANARSSLLRTMVVSSFELFGTSALARSFPMGWRFLYQNAGEATVVRDPAHLVTTIELTHLHSVQRASPAYALSMKLAIEGFAEAVGQPAVIEIDDTRQRAGTLRFHARLPKADGEGP